MSVSPNRTRWRIEKGKGASLTRSEPIPLGTAPARHRGMALRQNDPVHRDGHTERIERVEHFHEGNVASPTPATNVNVGPAAPANDVVTAFTRLVLVVFTTLEVLLLLRFVFKLSGANAGQPLIAGLYG